MQNHVKPLITRMAHVTPINGFGGAVFRIDPAINLDDGRTTNYITTSFGSEKLLGDGNTFSVFASDETGRILEWQGIYSDCEGPEWCLTLIDDAQHLLDS